MRVRHCLHSAELVMRLIKNRTHRFRHGRKCLVDFAPQTLFAPSLLLIAACRAAMAPPPIIRASFISFEIRWEGNLGSMLDRARRRGSLFRSCRLSSSIRASDRAAGDADEEGMSQRERGPSSRTYYASVICPFILVAQGNRPSISWT